MAILNINELAKTPKLLKRRFVEIGNFCRALSIENAKHGKRTTT